MPYSATALLDTEWISVGVLVVLLALFLWRSGAPPRQVALVADIVLLGIIATASLWAWLESWTD